MTRVREELPDLLHAYSKLVLDEVEDWPRWNGPFLDTVTRLHARSTNATQATDERLPFAPLLTALERALRGDRESSLAILRQARNDLIGPLDLSEPIATTFTDDNLARVRAHRRAAVLACFFASCGGSDDALRLFAPLAAAGRQTTLWEKMLLSRCLLAIEDFPRAFHVASTGLQELLGRRKQLDKGSLRLNFGGRIGPALVEIVVTSVLRGERDDERLRHALFVLDLRRDPLLAEIVHTARQAPLPIRFKLDLIRACWSAEAEAFQWRTLRSRLLTEHGSDGASASTEQRQVSAEQEVERARGRLQQAAPGIYSAFFRPGRVLLRSPVVRTVVADVQAELKEGTAILGFDLAGDDVIGWTLTRERFTLARLPISTTALTAHVHAVTESCRTGALASERMLQPLADALLQQSSGVLESNDRVLIVPSGPLRALPFAALPWRGRPLLSSHVCSVLPGLGLFKSLANRQPDQKPSIAAFGNPSGMRWTPPVGDARDAPALRHAEREAREVAALAGATPFCGPLATRDEVTRALRSASIVHLATHAVFCEEAPLFSAFLLADGGQLSVIDSLGLDSGCELIVASACSTGEGRRTSGDDVLGISRGLLGCGAAAAVVSLWPVDDERTAELMIAFYRGVLAGTSPAQALCDAQRGFLKVPGRRGGTRRDSGSPASRGRTRAGPEQWWSPFVLVGV